MTIDAPVDAAVTLLASIDLRGTVNDAVEAGIGAPEPTVRVRNETTG